MTEEELEHIRLMECEECKAVLGDPHFVNGVAQQDCDSCKTTWILTAHVDDGVSIKSE